MVVNNLNSNDNLNTYVFTSVISMYKTQKKNPLVFGQHQQKTSGNTNSP